MLVSRLSIPARPTSPTSASQFVSQLAGIIDVPPCCPINNSVAAILEVLLEVPRDSRTADISRELPRTFPYEVITKFSARTRSPERSAPVLARPANKTPKTVIFVKRFNNTDFQLCRSFANKLCPRELLSARVIAVIRADKNRGRLQLSRETARDNRR